MRRQHKFTDLSITVVSLFSIFFHFLFPGAAIAAETNKKSITSFNYSNQIKPYSIVLADSSIKKPNIIPNKTNKVDYLVSAIIINDSQNKNEKSIKKNVDNAAHEEFNEYIAKDRYIDVEKDALLAAGNVKIISKKKVLITAYSSTPDQTDSTPFITAANTHVHNGIIASNFLPFGAKIRIPSLYPNKIFTVEDRMKSDTKMDIWFSSRQEALNFGAKIVETEIVENL